MADPMPDSASSAASAGGVNSSSSGTNTTTTANDNMPDSASSHSMDDTSAGYSSGNNSNPRPPKVKEAPAASSEVINDGLNELGYKNYTEGSRAKQGGDENTDTYEVSVKSASYVKDTGAKLETVEASNEDLTSEKLKAATPFRSFTQYIGSRGGNLNPKSGPTAEGMRETAGRLNYKYRLQERSRFNEGILDIAENIRNSENMEFYAAINAGYGNFATEEVLTSIVNRSKHLKDNKATLSDVIKVVVGATNNEGTMNFIKQLIFGEGEKGNGNVADQFKDTIINPKVLDEEESEKVDEGLFSKSFLDHIKDLGDKAIEAKDYLASVFSSGFEFLKDTKKAITSGEAAQVVKIASRVWNKIGTLFYRAVDSHMDLNNPVQTFKDTVMNLPPSPSIVIDPLHRLYSNNVVATTHVLNILPGQLSWGGITAREAGTSSYLLEKELNKFSEGGTGVITLDITSAMYKLLRASEDRDKKLGMFTPTPNQFQRVYNTMMAKVLGRLSPKTAVSMIIEDWNDGSVTKSAGASGTESKGNISLNGWGHFSIALGPNCTITETGSNSYGKDDLSQALETIGTRLKEYYNNATMALGSAFAKNRQDNLRLLADRGNIGSLLMGEKTHLPKFWNSSDFNRSYTLSFRLESPYGDYESLVEYVYRPFITLLTCSLPIQTSFYGAMNPFCLRLDCPGMFTISEGYVSSIDFRRAPDVGTYNANGIATAIEVNITIEDIDPWLSLPVGPMTFSTNINMQAWLDSLCGVSYQEIYTGGSLASRIEQTARYARMLPPSLKNSISSSFSEGVWKFFNLGNSR